MTVDPSSTFAALLDIWNGAPVEGLRDLLAPRYRGHMLHSIDGERDAAQYPGVVERYRAANPSTTFEVVDQLVAGDRVVSRLEAHRTEPATGAVLTARGINISRVAVDGRLAEEWAIWSPWLDDPRA